MLILIGIGLVLLGYVLGSIPFGVIIVWLKTGQDIRTVESGRTGGTNAMRAAGAWAGVVTGIMDAVKGAAAVWAAQLILPGNHWVQILAPVAAILGHNYSLFLPERDKNGHIIRLRGGAGGAPALGGAVGLWFPSLFIIFPVGIAVFFLLGYASVTTMSIGLTAIAIFTVRAALGAAPWTDAVYGLMAEILLVWSLRPNIKKLFGGTERIVGVSLHGKIKSRGEKKEILHETP